jgi:hypothetical protein
MGCPSQPELSGYTRGSLKVELYSDHPKACANVVETAIRETVRHGQPEIAHRLLHRFTMAAAEAVPVALNAELLELETELDAEEDKAEVAYLLDPSAVTWDTYQRRLIKLRAVIDLVLAGGNAQWKRA